MNMRNKDYESIQKLVAIVSEHTDILNEEELETYTSCINALNELNEKRLKDNERNWKLISEKRKTNKNYGRTLNENGKQKSYYKKKDKKKSK